jgi:hypothetical protein
MKRSLWLAALLAAAACGGGDNLVVRATLDPAGDQPAADLPVRILPYDRKAILDSLGAESGAPLPQFPRDAAARLRSLQAAASGVKPADPAAAAGEQQAVRAYVATLDSIRRARDQWLHAHQKDFQEAAVQASHGLAEQADTTDAAGRATFKAEPGRWWVVARYILPDRALEWSVPVTAREDSVVVRLRRGNAKEEPFF